MHNTDPFVFGDSFLYSNCRQPSQPGLRALAEGSVVAFGSAKKVFGTCKWTLDTVFVVRDSSSYDPRNPREALQGKVPDAFLEVTGGPLAAAARGCGNGSIASACGPKSLDLRLYQGATPDDPVNGMFSFFPAVPAGNRESFLRPFVHLPRKCFSPRICQAPKGLRYECTPDAIQRQWTSLVGQVRRADLVLGTFAEMPPRRRE